MKEKRIIITSIIASALTIALLVVSGVISKTEVMTILNVLGKWAFIGFLGFFSLWALAFASVLYRRDREITKHLKAEGKI